MVPVIVVPVVMVHASPPAGLIVIGTAPLAARYAKKRRPETATADLIGDMPLGKRPRLAGIIPELQLGDIERKVMSPLRCAGRAPSGFCRPCIAI
jgi:hypothetical protein